MRSELSPSTEDLKDRRYGYLVVVAFVHYDSYRRSVWSCVCDCGGTKEVRSDRLVSGETEDCSTRAVRCSAPGRHTSTTGRSGWDVGGARNVTPAEIAGSE